MHYKARSKGQMYCKEVVIEDNVWIGNNVVISAGVTVGWPSRPSWQNVYRNFNCTLVDDAQIYIGDGTRIGPNVIIAVSHPVSPKLRAAGYDCNKPVHIGKNVWIAANVIVMGSPGRGVRTIDENDEVYYDHGKLIAENII